MDSFTGDVYDNKYIYKIINENSPSSTVIIPPKEGSKMGANQ